MIMNSEYIRISKELLVVYLEILSAIHLERTMKCLS
jgi:hypothetical protein